LESGSLKGFGKVSSGPTNNLNLKEKNSNRYIYSRQTHAPTYRLLYLAATV
jgi:hypothetical protein